MLNPKASLEMLKRPRRSDQPDFSDQTERSDQTDQIFEGRATTRVSPREARYRRLLALADVLSATVAAVIAIEILGDDALALLALLMALNSFASAGLL